MSDFLNTYELYHHGILGQKWGVRRYQNPDGSLLTKVGERVIESYKRMYGDDWPEHYKDVFK